jgi:hypothetical protein
MPTYRIRFLKVICDDTGHEHHTCQSTIDVDADSADLALASARDEFASQRRGMDWRFYADRVEIELHDSPPAYKSAR